MAQQSDNNSRSGRHFATKLSTRSRGLLMLIIGLGLAKWQIYDPLHAREQGLEEVTVSSLLVGLAVLVSVLGAATLVMGDRLERIFEDIRDRSKASQLEKHCCTVANDAGSRFHLD